MDWREGTLTMTEGVKLKWDFDADEIMIDTGDDNFIYLSDRQAENVITGLSYQLNEMRKARNRAES